MSDTSTTSRWTVRDLPCAARLTLALFLISVGIGYFSALVQLHFQHARPGEIMPTGQDAVEKFHGPTGETPKSQIVRLIAADPEGKFNGTGQMSAAFFKRSDFAKVAKQRAKKLAKGGDPGDAERAQAEADLRKERETERKAMLAWLESEGNKEAYEKDMFRLPETLAKEPITKEFVADEPGHVKIKSLFEHRCTRCHTKDGGDDAKAAAYPMEKWEHISKHNKVEASGAMSLEKLAQTTHVHLLGFSMLYGLTGLILALTNLPNFIRLPLAPLPLLAQVLDISFWWLARLDAPYGPMFAHMIPVSGAVVGASLELHILLSLFAMFGWRGRTILVVLMLVAGFGGYVVKEKVIDPHMETERATINSTK